MAPPKEANQTTNQTSNQTKQFIMNGRESRNERKQLMKWNGINWLISSAAALSGMEHQAAPTAARQAKANTNKSFFMKMICGFCCGGRNEQSKSFLSINSQIWWIDEEMNCLCEWSSNFIPFFNHQSKINKTIQSKKFDWLLLIVWIDWLIPLH